VGCGLAGWRGGGGAPQPWVTGGEVGKAGGRGAEGGRRLVEEEDRCLGNRKLDEARARRWVTC
jgi:hypothetical protein